MIGAEARPALRNDWIDSLRGMSSLAVVLFHLVSIPLTGSPQVVTSLWISICSHGHLGVAVFFTLSGYCLIHTWTKSPNIWAFLKRRLRRVFPPYYASLVLVIAVVIGTKLITGVNDVTALPRDFVSVLATLSLTTTPVTDAPTVNWVYWTLTYEVTFYLILALLLVGPASRFRLFLLPIAHFCFCLLAMFDAGQSRPSAFFIGLWPIFGLGAALALFSHNRRAGITMLAGNALHAVFVFAVGGTQTYLVTAILTALTLLGISFVPFP